MIAGGSVDARADREGGCGAARTMVGKPHPTSVVRAPAGRDSHLSNGAGGLSWVVRSGHAVSDAALREDIGGVCGVVAELSPHTLDEGANHLGVAGVTVLSHPSQKRIVRRYSSRVGSEHAKQFDSVAVSRTGRSSSVTLRSSWSMTSSPPKGSGVDSLRRGCPDSRRQLRRRAGLDDVVDGSEFQSPGNRFIPSVAGQEYDGYIHQFGNRFHQLDSVGSGIISPAGRARDSSSYEPGYLVVIAGHDGTNPAVASTSRT